MVELGNLSINFGDLNWFAMVVAVVVAMLIGMVWYMPPVLGKRWMEALGTTEEEIIARGNRALSFVTAIVGAVISVTVLAILIQLTGVSTVVGGLTIGLLAVVGLLLAPMATMYMFEGRPGKLFLISAPENAISVVTISIILAAWQ